MEFINNSILNKNKYSQKIKDCKYTEGNKVFEEIVEKSYDDICEIIISQNELEYSILDDSEKSQYSKKKKLEIASSITTDIYNTSFKKNLISQGLQNLNMFSSILYLNDFYQCNCTIFNKDTNKYYKTGIKEGKVVLCKYYKNKWYLDEREISNDFKYSDLDDLKNIVKMDIETNMIYKLYLKPLSKYKLNELHEIANELNIQKKLNGKNKLKKVLYDEINLKKLMESI